MQTLFGNLEVGRKSLLAQQLALQVTGNNIANVNTPGYTRQRAVLAESLAQDTPAGPIGTGVDVQTVESVRDQFLEARLGSVIQDSSREDAVAGYLNQVQSVSAVSQAGLRDALSRFFNSFSGTKVPEGACTVRLMRRSCVDALLSVGDRSLWLGAAFAWVGFRQVARPVSRLSGRRRKALRWNGAACRARMVSSRARPRSRSAASSTWGTETGGRAPARLRRASVMASRRVVVPRSPGFLGSKEGATPQQTWPVLVRERESQDPQGPASETKRRCWLVDCLFRRR